MASLTKWLNTRLQTGCEFDSCCRQKMLSVKVQELRLKVSKKKDIEQIAWEEIKESVRFVENSSFIGRSTKATTHGCSVINPIEGTRSRAIL